MSAPDFAYSPQERGRANLIRGGDSFGATIGRVWSGPSRDVRPAAARACGTGRGGARGRRSLDRFPSPRRPSGRGSFAGERRLGRAATARWPARSPPSRSAGSARSARRSLGFLEKGMPQKRRAARMDADRRRGADPVSRRSRPCRGRSRGARDARRSGQRPVRGARQRGAAQHRPGAGDEILADLRSARRRHAGLARARAGARPMARRRARAIAARQPRGADARPHASRATPEGWADAARRARAADRLGPARHASRRSPELDGYAEGEWWVQDAAAALPARLLRLAPGRAGRRPLRRAGRQDRAARRGRRRA